ncbi:MAG: hypothetical protein NVS9B4_18500 [Candidatus Acidiferrum sp.]
MAGSVLPDIEIGIEEGGGGGPGNKIPPLGGDSGGDRGGDREGKRPDSDRPDGSPDRRYHLGIGLGIVSIVMIFLTLAGTYIFRRRASGGWTTIRFPEVLLLNTAVLLASSVTLEIARGWLGRLSVLKFRRWWLVTTALGVMFLVGQALAWLQMARQGVFMASNPASSFFYIFTGAHALHLCGGAAGLLYVFFWKPQEDGLPTSTAVHVAAYYWHFMDALWVCLLALLYFGR